MMHNRKLERAELIRLFVTGASAQLLAPRRVGKTWLMNKVAEDLNEQGWLAVVVDVEGMRSEEEFLQALCRKLQENDEVQKQVFNVLSQRLKQMIEGDWTGKPIDAIGRIDSKAFAEALISSLNDHEKNTVILVDEISLFVLARMREDSKATHDFLYNLRRLCQSYSRVRWLFTGSIGLNVVARRGNMLGALVDLEIFNLEPFNEEAALSYIKALCSAGDIRCPFWISDGEFEFLAEELGWLSPYYLKLVADRIMPTGNKAQNNRPTATRKDIEAAFKKLLQPNQRGSFAIWEEHLEKNFEEREASQMRMILNMCCEAVNGEKEATLLTRLDKKYSGISRRELMDLLTALFSDGVLHKLDERWRFRSGLLRRYWLEYWHE